MSKQNPPAPTPPVKKPSNKHLRVRVTTKKLLACVLGGGFLCAAGVLAWVFIIVSDLPRIITLQDYRPKLTTEVFDKHGEKIGEFFNEKRILVPYEDLPQTLKQAFIAAEDASFFTHKGVNPRAIVRAFWANMREGKKVQGASTITQQVARTLLLSPDKTYTRKAKEALLALKMERGLSKEEILYLYLNQIYLGHGAWGVGMASRVYFRKEVSALNLAECALLAGLPKAPGRYTPLLQPKRAKQRQLYVLDRMLSEGYISLQEYERTKDQDLVVYLRKDYTDVAPYFVEEVRQILSSMLGEEQILEGGLKIYTTLDASLQNEAQRSLRKGLKELDKRQGYRGAARNLDQEQAREEFLEKNQKSLISQSTDKRVLKYQVAQDGERTLVLEVPYATVLELNQNQALPGYLKVGQELEALVTHVDDKWGLVKAQLTPDTRGAIDIANMVWARKPDPKVSAKRAPEVQYPSKVLKVGDVIRVKVLGASFALKNKAVPKKLSSDLASYVALSLEQEPKVQGGVLALDHKKQSITAMVGGYDFELSKFNRTLQALRQTGSAFKPVVYAAALDFGYKPNSVITDAPLVYDRTEAEEKETPTDDANKRAARSEQWRPKNAGLRFLGDVLFRNALIRSLNVPTIKIIEKIGISRVEQYAKSLGIFSPLNRDFTMALGSSSISMYEITKAFAQFARLGMRIRPLIVLRVEDVDGNELVANVSLDEKFKKELDRLEEGMDQERKKFLKLQADYEALKLNANSVSEDSSLRHKLSVIERQLSYVPKVFFDDPDRVLSQQTAYIVTHLLRGAIFDPGGTGARARSLGRMAAGKTGSTSSYYDAWFIGYTPEICSSVWVGYDEEQSLGLGEVGGRAALPVWLDFMKAAHKNLEPSDFIMPLGIVLANINNETGSLAANKEDEKVVSQAFLSGTEPLEIEVVKSAPSSDANFLKESN